MITFNEVYDFDLNDYMPHIGWIGDKTIKIYSKEDSAANYHFDGECNKLFEIITDIPKLNNYKIYNDVVAAFKVFRQLEGIFMSAIS